MTRYLVERTAWLLVVLLGVSVITFGLGAAAPGDPAELALERELNAPPTGEQMRAKRQELHLDRSLVEQYARWLGDAVRGDLGESWATGASVTASLRERMPRTVLLALTALGLSIAMALPVGLAAAYHRDTAVDHATRVTSMLGASVPSYMVAYLLTLFLAVRLKVLPVFGYGSPSDLALPALTLALGSAAGLTRFTRSAVLDVLGEDFLRTARAKGVGVNRLLFGHALRNAGVPIVSVVGLSLGGLLGGAFIVEWIFAWPGMGTLAIEAINNKDYPLIQGFVLFSATVYVLVNFLTDLAYGALDPRIRLVRGDR
ncbi:MAG TPA: ABC transporter permease [Acidimicrobiales bacterium]|nr:ABC transporter permease [Acidimicrobiales bacterium]